MKLFNVKEESSLNFLNFVIQREKSYILHHHDFILNFNWYSSIIQNTLKKFSEYTINENRFHNHQDK